MSNLIRSIPIRRPRYSHYNGTPAAGVAATWVTPAENTNGLIIHDAEMYTTSGTLAAISTILLKTSAPSSSTDGEIVLAASASLIRRLHGPVFVAAGLGVYLWATANGHDCRAAISIL